MQEGSKKLNKYLLKAVKILLIAVIVTAITINIFKTDKTMSAGEYTITVNKVSTVSVYVSGPGVMLESSNTDKDVYRVDGGTTARFHAVNESRIFTGWDIKNGDTTVNSTTTPITTETVNSNLTVSVTRKDATTDDYGKYMLDRYVISDEAELIALQNILNGSTNNSDFAHFYDDANGYDTTDEKNTLRTAMNSGYYLIANNFVVFNSDFVGLGTTANPFNGVMCGLNNGVVSSIFSTISVAEQNGTNAYGLFKALGENAVIRNLNVVTTVGMTAATNNIQNGVQYIGGLAGTMNNSLLVNVTVEAKMGISVNNSALHVGGIVGYSTSGGFESVGNVKYNGDSTSWTIQSTYGSTIDAGLVAGYTKNVYVNSMNIDVTNSTIDLKADADASVSLGNLFGNCNTTSTTTLKNINIMGSKGQILRTVVNQGNSYVGGLIGYVNTNTNSQYLNIGKVDFNVLGSKNIYTSTSTGSSSTANLYTGGLIGYVNGSYCNALDTFKNRLSTITVDESEVKVFDYLFEGDYEITSVQNGTATATTNTKSIAGGLVGKGIIDIDGGSSLAFASPTSSLYINATQSKFTDTSGTMNDKEHACAALIYGSVGSTNLNIDNVDIYSNNTTIETLREIGSKAMGDLHTGTFVGYVEASTLQNIGIYLNDSSLMARSLSYETDAKNGNTDTNSAFCGGLVGQATNASTLTDITFAGYNPVNAEVVGTTSTMESIQNTPPGIGDYKGENYIGGIVGRIQYVTLTDCKYLGSDGSEDYIKMSGHESPDSAFCGGIVGMIRTGASTAAPSSIVNCEISNAYVYAAATNRIQYDNPDIYVGGIVGAAYMHGTASTVSISSCKVLNTDVYGLGNDYIAVYAGGVLGGSTWQQSITIEDVYVSSGSVQANLMASSGANYKYSIVSAASGIVGMQGGSTGVTVSNSAVIDVIVNANTNYIGTNYNSPLSANAAGIGASHVNGFYTINNCYSNALVNAYTYLNSTSRQDYYDKTYSLSSKSTNTSGSTTITNGYYLSKNVTSEGGGGTSVPSTGFAAITETAVNIYSGISDLNGTYGYGDKLIFVSNSSYFETTRSLSATSKIRCTDMNSYHSAMIDVWINCKDGGDDDTTFTGSPLVKYGSMKAANDAGWFLFDSVLVNNGVTASVSSSSINDIDSDYLDGSNMLSSSCQTIWLRAKVASYTPSPK